MTLFQGDRADYSGQEGIIVISDQLLIIHEERQACSLGNDLQQICLSSLLNRGRFSPWDQNATTRALSPFYEMKSLRIMFPYNKLKFAIRVNLKDIETAFIIPSKCNAVGSLVSDESHSNLKNEIRVISGIIRGNVPSSFSHQIEFPPLTIEITEII